MRFIFFSLNTFEKDDGGSIRMYGVLNALAENNNEVIFISNAKNKEKFHPNIKHQVIDFKVSYKTKRILQGLTSSLPSVIVCLLYKKLIKTIEELIEKVFKPNDVIYSFEYLDNTIAYLLYKKNKKHKYINDIHGIVTIEFKYQYVNATKWDKKINYYIKYLSAYYLDKKVFTNAVGLIYVSTSMQKYYTKLYKKVKSKKSYILPCLLSNVTNRYTIKKELAQQIKDNYNIKPKDFVLFFAGSYKPTAGVEDLIQAYVKLYKKHSNLKMLLIGDGPTKSKCVNIIKEKKICDRIILINNVPYEKLITYQSVANVVVCPDRQNLYSELIVHLKYFDSLNSGKLVINGGFKSVKDINKDNFLSLTFKPSDVDSLTKTIEKCIKDYNALKEKYKGTKEYTNKNLTYKSLAHRLYV